MKNRKARFAWKKGDVKIEKPIAVGRMTRRLWFDGSGYGVVVRGRHRRFNLFRHEDKTGVSGTGIVAQGVQFASGKVVLNWATDHTSTTVFDSIEEVEAVHGHGGKTEVIWLDE